MRATERLAPGDGLAGALGAGLVFFVIVGGGLVLPFTGPQIFIDLFVALFRLVW